MKLPVIELFASVQGEGMYTGIPSIFLRVTGCNLRCRFKNSICDSAYSSFHPEKPIYNSMEDLVKAYNELIEQYPNINHLVITGGEPMLYKEGIDEFLKIIYNRNLKITIETNGTLEPLPLSGSYHIDLYSVSPKLSTSCFNNNDNILTKAQIEKHNNTRINIDNLCKYAVTQHNYQFKFVYSDQECIDEINDIYKRMDECIEKNYSNSCITRYKYSHPNTHTQLMPEGMINSQLSKISEECANVCMEKGWRFCDRLHIRIWGDKRGV